MDEQELNEKLARWVGFTQQKNIHELPTSERHEANLGWVYLGGQRRRYPPDFAQSLDACFKWLVPKVVNLYKPFGIRCILESTNSRYWNSLTNDNAHYLRPEIPHVNIRADADTPVLALCLAIEKLIDKEAKNDTKRVT